ncbi:MAG: insulinase family protein [Lactobacillaceae bacterium]|jgi:predicted Zn-dependent peptidase|nr:insulinase family protein [Lactobacillaceae bacterium]
MIQSGSENYQSRQEISIALDELFGARLEVFSTSSGNISSIEFSVKFPNATVLNEQILDKVLFFSSDLVFNSVFDSKVFEVEKNNLIDEYRQILDDKSNLAFLNARQHFFLDKHYQQFDIGDLEEISGTTLEDIEQEYREFLVNNKVDISYVGTDSINQSFFKKFNNKIPKLSFKPEYQFKDYNETEIYDDVDQSQMVQLYLFENFVYSPKNFFVAKVFNEIFGGNASSLLFRNVREKLHLAYSVNSWTEIPFGIFYVSAGFDNGTRNVLLREIDEQLKNVQNQEIDLELFMTAKKTILDREKKRSDNISFLARSIIQTKYSQIPFDPLEVKKILDGIELKDVVLLSRTIKLKQQSIVISKDDDEKTTNIRR